MVKHNKNKKVPNPTENNAQDVDVIPVSDTFSYVELAEYLNKKYRFYYDRIKTHLLYVYKNGAYVIPDDLINEEGVYLFRANKKVWRSNYIAETINILKAISKRKVKEAPSELINVGNGIYDLRTKQLSRFSPTYFLTGKMPVKITGNIPKKSKLKEIVENILEGDNYKLFFEFAGYGLLSTYIKAGCLFIVGGGSNGKSTLLKILQSIYGEYAISIPLQELNDEEKRAGLFKRNMNIVAEQPSKALLSTEMFKSLTDGDQVSARFLYHDTFYFNNYAKFIFSANQAPKLKDASYGLKRRVYVVELTKVLDGSISESDIKKILSNPAEREWFFNEMVNGLHRIWMNGNEFSVMPAGDRYNILSDPFDTFINERVKVSEGEGMVVRSELYDAYMEYCEKNSVPVFMRASKKKFYSDIRDTFKDEVTEFEENAGKHLRYFKGIELIR